MASSINITFLGTGSATPCFTRNQSALALRLDGDVWIFDCGEATLSQIQKSSVKMGRIQKVFITHTHGDHIFGLVPLLSSRLNGAGGLALGQEDPRTKVDMTQQHIEIYGPLGTRAYVRAGLIYTHTLLDAPYVVHELHTPSDSQDDRPDLPLHPAESPLGRNIPLVDGVWRDIYKDERVSVSAAPILHSVPCIGYVVNEAPAPGKMDARDYIPHIKRTKTPMSIMGQLQKGESVTLADGTVLRGPERRKGRKIVILGDTYDPSPMLPLAEGADILVHEATNAHLPGIDAFTKDSDTYESVETRAKSRGHSTPQMAGAFARRVNAKRLILNHFSPRYSSAQTDGAKKIMSSIAELAAREYSGDVICAEDLMSIDINLEPIV